MPFNMNRLGSRCGPVTALVLTRERFGSRGSLKLTTFNGAVGQPAANTAVHFTHPRLCMRLHCLHELGFLLGVEVPDMPAGSWIEVDRYELQITSKRIRELRVESWPDALRRQGRDDGVGVCTSESRFRGS